MAPASVRRVALSAAKLLEIGRARPKSSSFTPCGVRNRFDGFRSRWISSARVQRVEGVEDLQRDGGGIGRRQRPTCHARAERLAREELHRHDQPLVGLLDFVELADVGMRDAGRGPGLTPQPFARRVVDLAANRLQGDRAIEPFIAGRVHDPHAAFADLPFDLVAPDTVGHRRRRRGGHKD